jgi:uncharacterized membrane protein
MIFSIIAIVLVIISVLLVTFNKIKSKWYAWLIYFAGLFTAYSTTMVGMSVVGSDISRELLMSNLAVKNGWDLSIFDPSNTSWVVGVFVPFMSQIFHVGAEWIYKVVLPMIFAFAPALLYFIFRKQIGDLKAFYASMFFIIVPVYALEICTIGKSMVAETFMALTLWVLFNVKCDKSIRTVVVFMLVLLTLWAHYTIGLLLCIYLGGICLYWIIRAFRTKMDFRIYGESALAMIGILMLEGIFFYVYYSNVAQGLIWNSSTSILHSDVSQSVNVIQKSLNDNFTAPQNISATVKAYGLVKSALGLDLLQYSWSGIAFRVVQLLTQLLIVVGFGWMLWKRNYPKDGILTYRWNSEFVAGYFVAFGLLGLCVVVPAFASLINATREYHLALFFLAPCFVIAFDAIGVCLKWSVK